MADAGTAYRGAVGRTIHRLRIERRWALKDLSAASGVSVPYLSEIERGLKEPSGAMLAQLAEAFALSPARLLVAIAETLDRRTEVALAEGQHRVLRSLIEEFDDDEVAELTRFAGYLRWRRGAANGDT